MIFAYGFNRGINRRLKTKVHWFYPVLGAMLPDVFHVSDSVIGWLSEHFLNLQFHSELLIDIGKFMHSFTTFALIFSIAFFAIFLIRSSLNYGKTLAFLFGWGFFHIVVDLLTHDRHAWPYFWPLSEHSIKGFVDHSKPLMFAIEAIVCLIWLTFIIKKRNEKVEMSRLTIMPKSDIVDRS